jgi:transposase
MTAMQNLSIEQLQNQLSERDGKIVDLDTKLSESNQKIMHLEEQLNWFKKQIFGRRSERDVSHINANQLEFAGFESLVATPQEGKKIAAHTRRDPQKKGKEAIVLPSDLPVETIILDIPEEQKICQETGIPLVKIGEEVTLKLAHKPGSFYIKEIIRPKYAHPKQEEKGIVIAEMPDGLLTKCRADESFLAFILTKKFVDHMPLYRICEGLQREGITISRKLLSQWVIRCGMALMPLYEEMKKHILQSKNVFIDETPVKIQEKVKCKTGFMWMIVGGEGADPPYRIYDFRENRCHDNALDILMNYEGNLHSDKYGAYVKLGQKKNINWCPCFAHIRRKFFEAETGDPVFRDWVIRKMKYLFMFERTAWLRSPEERVKIRQEKEAPIIDELITKIKEKLTDGKILPKSKLKEAINYFCGLIPHLKNYTKSPWARLDNNVAERAIRPLAIGRKNWLFFGSVEGGEAGAVILSLLQTCRGLGMNPMEYLEDVMRRLMSHNAQKLHELLPDQWKKAREQKPPSCCSGQDTKLHGEQAQAAADDGASTEERELATEAEGERGSKSQS